MVVVQHRSMSKAAEELNMSQPGLSKSIRSLEERLGAKLLDRTSNGVVPTEPGNVLLEHAKLIVIEERNALSNVFDARDGYSGTIRLGAVSSWMGKMLPRVVVEFQKTRPKVRFKIQGGHKARVIAALINNDLDLAFAGAPSEVISPQLSMIVLASDNRGVIARQDHPLAKLDQVSIEQLQEFPWVLPTRQLGIEDPIVRKFMERGFSPPEPLIETESWQFLMELLRSTNSLSISNQEMLTHSNSAGIRFLRCPELTSKRKTGVLYVTGRTLSPAAMSFVEVLKRVCKNVGRI